ASLLLLHAQGADRDRGPLDRTAAPAGGGDRVTRIVLVGVLTSIGAIVGILVLIRTRRLQERVAILSLLAAAGIVILGLWTEAEDEAGAGLPSGPRRRA